MAMTVSLIGLLLLLFFPCRMSDDRVSYIDKVLHAIENIVHYYTKNYYDLNVDGLFGLRVLEGHLDLLVQEYDAGHHRNISSVVVSKLRLLKTLTTTTSEKAVEYVKRDDEEYYDRLRFVVGHPWSFLKTHREFNQHLQWSPEVYTRNKKAKLDEETSDQCMGELMGTNPQSNTQTCQISNYCLALMTTKGLTGYGITHQILWTMLAEVNGCAGIVNQMMLAKGVGSLDIYREEFCVNNYFEMTESLKGLFKGRIIPKYQDLFLEQQFVCPSLGFYQFLSFEYLDQILSWQKNVGCYGSMPKPKEGVFKTASSDLDQYNYMYDDDGNGDQRLNQDHPDLNYDQNINQGQNLDGGQSLNQQENVIRDQNIHNAQNMDRGQRLNQQNAIPNQNIHNAQNMDGGQRLNQQNAIPNQNIHNAQNMDGGQRLNQQNAVPKQNIHNAQNMDGGQRLNQQNAVPNQSIHNGQNLDGGQRLNQQNAIPDQNIHSRQNLNTNQDQNFFHGQNVNEEHNLILDQNVHQEHHTNKNHNIIQTKNADHGQIVKQMHPQKADQETGHAGKQIPGQVIDIHVNGQYQNAKTFDSQVGIKPNIRNTNNLQRVTLGTGQSETKKILVEAQVKENNNVVIQKNHGLVGKFVSEQIKSKPVHNSAKLGVKTSNTLKNHSDQMKPHRNVQQIQQKNAPQHLPNQKYPQNPKDPVNFVPGVKMIKQRKRVENSENNQQIAEGHFGRHLLSIKHQRIADFVTGTHFGRHLLAEKAMKGGCLAHKTAVASGALIIYLRYLIQPGTSQLNQQSSNPPRFLMSMEVTKRQSLNRNIVTAAMVRRTQTNASDPGRPLLKQGLPGEVAMNNNVLAQQLHVSNDNDEDENYYVQDEDNKGDVKENEVYKDNIKKTHRLVQFDNGNGFGVNAKIHEDDNYGDDYKEDKNENMERDYNEENAAKNKGFDDIRIQVGRKPVIPKADEHDYTYYEENNNNQHDDYTNEDVEHGDKVISKGQHVQHNVKGEAVVQKKEIISEYQSPKLYYNSGANGTPTVMFMMISASMSVLVFLMYRFIRSRRVHIRYHPRNLMKV